MITFSSTPFSKLTRSCALRFSSIVASLYFQVSLPSGQNDRERFPGYIVSGCVLLAHPLNYHPFEEPEDAAISVSARPAGPTIKATCLSSLKKNIMSVGSANKYVRFLQNHLSRSLVLLFLERRVTIPNRAILSRNQNGNV